jgi:hypothetical protein
VGRKESLEYKPYFSQVVFCSGARMTGDTPFAFIISVLIFISIYAA